VNVARRASEIFDVPEELLTERQKEFTANFTRLLASYATLDKINSLRVEEGQCVMLCCDNNDFNGQPQCRIEVSADWTGWHPEVFMGDTLDDALDDAITTKALRRNSTIPRSVGEAPVPTAMHPEAALLRIRDRVDAMVRAAKPLTNDNDKVTGYSIDPSHLTFLLALLRTAGFPASHALPRVATGQRA
jgi:hypothetical protein